MFAKVEKLLVFCKKVLTKGLSSLLFFINDSTTTSFSWWLLSLINVFFALRIVAASAEVDAEVPINSAKKDKLSDHDLATFLNTDGDIANAWFEVKLGTASKLAQLRLTPRVGSAYGFDAYVDNSYVGSYSTRSAASVVRQDIDLRLAPSDR